MKSEGEVQAEIRGQFGQAGYRVFRNNVGVATDRSGRPVRFGIANDSAALNKRIKSSDLIGFTPNGTFISIECKHEGWKIPKVLKGRVEAQKRWIDMVRRDNGIAGFATCWADVEELLMKRTNRHDHI